MQQLDPGNSNHSAAGFKGRSDSSPINQDPIGSRPATTKPFKTCSSSQLNTHLTVDDVARIMDARDYKLINHIESKLLLHDNTIRKNMYELLVERQQAAEARERERRRAVSPKLQPSCCGIMVGCGGAGKGPASRTNNRHCTSTVSDVRPTSFSQLQLHHR